MPAQRKRNLFDPASPEPQPRELAEAFASILHSGLVNLRGSAGHDRRYVEVEASHLHNLPWCLCRMKEADIRHYYEVERPRYLEALRRIGEAAALAPDYGHHWDAIEDWLRGLAGGTR